MCLYSSLLMPTEDTPRQKKQALSPVNCCSMGFRSKKSLWMISLSLGCDTPLGLRLMTRTCSTPECFRHSSRTPSPTIPVDPVMRTFILNLVGVRRNQRSRRLGRTLHRAMLAHGDARQIGAFPQEHQRVAERFRFARLHLARELVKAPAHVRLVLLDHRSRRMVGLGDFHRGVGERATPRIVFARVLHQHVEERLDLQAWIARMGRDRFIPPQHAFTLLAAEILC